MKGEPSIRLSRREKAQLEDILTTKATTPRERARAQILRLSALGWSVTAVMEATGASRSTVGRARRWFRERGLETAVYDAKRSGRPATILESDVQRVVALACTEPPPGRSRWTVRLLAEETLRRKLIKKISRERIRCIIRDHELKPWREKMWCIPRLDDEFIERMEDLLALYERPHNSKEPVVCLDERPTPLRGEVRPSKRREDGSLQRDSEYKRRGVANIFGVVEPLAGRHLTRATKDRKSGAFARLMRDIERAYPKAKIIHAVMDNLSTHTKNALIRTFGEKEATRIWGRFSVHYTPKHGSWLNQAECELSICVRQCLGKRRIDSLDLLKKETAAWNRHANRRRITIDWKFSVKKAREKFGYRRPKTSLSEH